MKKQVLLYNINESNLLNIKNILDKMDIEVQVLNNQDCFQRVGTLAKLEGYEPIEVHEVPFDFSEEFIFMCHLSEEEMRDISKALKEANVTFNGIKAMLTETNKDWILVDLFKEVAKDHLMFQKIHELKNYIKMSNILDKTSFDTIVWSQYEQSLMSAYQYLQDKNYSMESLNDQVETIRKATEDLMRSKTA